MPKLNVVQGYYAPFKFINKSHIQEIPIDEEGLILHLNSAYRDALRKILFASPASFAEESPIFHLCIDFILNSNDLSKITTEWIEYQIDYSKELIKLRKMEPDDPNIEKLRLIKLVTTVHQDNLAFKKHILDFVNSTLTLEEILNKEYKYGVFIFAEKSDLQEREAIAALREALKEKPANLLVHLSSLRKGQLGEDIRVFVKQGLADYLLESREVRTVHEFIKALHKQVNPEPSIASINMSL